jgi:hypothetical protein
VLTYYANEVGAYSARGKFVAFNALLRGDVYVSNIAKGL